MSGLQCWSTSTCLVCIAGVQVQAHVWSALLEYEYMSGLQAADTVKQQAVQLASSKSQAAFALAAQKAAEQVKPKCRNAKCLVCCVEHESCHRFCILLAHPGSTEGKSL